MKITKRQLKRIIREEKARIQERGTRNPALADAERQLTTAIINWVDQYRLAMSMDPNDFGDDRRVRRTLDDIVGGLIS